MSGKPYISDHALNRYIERVYGIDMNKIRKEILSEKVCLAVKSGAASVTVDGFKYVIKNGAIVTVLKGSWGVGKSYTYAKGSVYGGQAAQS